MPKKSPTRKLNPDKRKFIQGRLVEIMRDLEPTAFAAEGPSRHGIRSSLCLQGWPWGAADAVAADIVAGALAAVGARRPIWYEGQPEWTQPGALPIYRDRCKNSNCRKPVPEGRRVFCSYECKRYFHGLRNEQARAEAIAVYQKAWYAARAAKLPERECEGCGRTFRPKKPKQRHCRAECARIVSA